ncbi:glycine-rich RNA-binding protein 3, mitochondrial-like [Anopheles albimanus]|uniref:Uncharacterized protein n=1 Tax=Anopheles albimanus TaxID=7167 RepID=A0A8W7JNT8_ANOAL|nr:glycine-rich RNA-binding protein 3, mitochondrial-like [Anopheles albimanus]
MFKFVAVVCCLMAVAWAMPAAELSPAIEAQPENPTVLLVQAAEADDSEDMVGAETAHHGGGYGGYGGGYGGYGGGFGGYGGGFGGYGGGFGGYGGHGYGGYGGFGGYGGHGHHGHHGHHG